MKEFSCNFACYFLFNSVCSSNFWVYALNIQVKPLHQYFCMILFIWYVVLTFESVDEVLWCDHSNDTSSAVLSRGNTNF